MAEPQVDGDRLRRGSGSLVHLVGRVEHLMTRKVEQVLAVAGLTVERWRVLDLLADGQGHAMREIATHAMVPAPTLTKIVDRLIDSALVYRRPDDTDRRRVLVFLSDRGRELHSQLVPAVDRAGHEVAEGLSEAELTHLVLLLRGLAG